MKHPKSAHVVMDATTQEFWCRHCGARFKPALPLTISAFVKQSKAFTVLHEACPAPAAQSVPP